MLERGQGEVNEQGGQVFGAGGATFMSSVAAVAPEQQARRRQQHGGEDDPRAAPFLTPAAAAAAAAVLAADEQAHQRAGEEAGVALMSAAAVAAEQQPSGSFLPQPRAPRHCNERDSWTKSHHTRTDMIDLLFDVCCLYVLCFSLFVGRVVSVRVCRVVAHVETTGAVKQALRLEGWLGWFFFLIFAGIFHRRGSLIIRTVYRAGVRVQGAVLSLCMVRLRAWFWVRVDLGWDSGGIARVGIFPPISAALPDPLNPACGTVSPDPLRY